MELLPFLPAWQLTTSTPAFAFPQLLQGPSSLELPPSSQHHLHDASNFLDLTLPPNALKILAESQASGRLHGLFNGVAGQPVRTAKTDAAAKRTTARSHSKANMWRAASASAYAPRMPAPRQVSPLPEVAQPQPPPAKARARRAARAARHKSGEAIASPAITTPSWRDGEQSTSQLAPSSTSAGQTVAPQVKATLISTHAGPYTAAEPSAPSWGEREHGEGRSTLDWGLFSWATATPAQISRHCGLDSLPLDLIEQVLPRFRAYLKESGHSAGANQTSPAPFPASVAPALPQDSCPPSVERSELLPAIQLPALFHAPEQPAPFTPTEYPATAPMTVSSAADDPDLSMMDCSTWVPEPEPSTEMELTAEPPSRAPTLEELEALLQEQDGAVLEPTVDEEPSAALEFFLDLEHIQAVVAGREEYPFAPPTRVEIEQSLCLPSNTHFSTELAQDAGMGGIWTGGSDFGRFLDGWEGWGELGCPDKM
jgi:hypothetical protein